jgi:epoxyqueuosine reductase
MDPRTDGSDVHSAPLSRRDLLKQALMAAAAFSPGICEAAQAGPASQQRGFGAPQGRRRPSAQAIDPSRIPAYAYRTLPVSHFPELQKEYERAVSSPQLSRQKDFRADIANLSYTLPSDFQNARSVVVMAAFARTMYATFHLDGQTYRIMVPFQYYRDDLNAESLATIVQKEIVKDPARRVVDVSERIPLKLLAARSGLGRYGRNNLIFVDGMGSYNLLYAFLTDHACPGDTWTDLAVLDICRRCDHCDRICPTYCILRDSFVINIDKCITLYNENAGAFPNWILPSMHHAMIGCMRCQAPCRVNGGVAEVSGTLGDVSEEETRKILQGNVDSAMLDTLQRKLRLAPAVSSKEMVPILARNLRALIRA